MDFAKQNPLKGYEDGLYGTGIRPPDWCHDPAYEPKALLSRGLRMASHPIIRFLRKEVIQPQVPLRLPCYDFTPVADPTVDGCPRS